MDFLQLRVRYKVSGKAGDQPIQFEAPGSAETFRGQLSVRVRSLERRPRQL